MKNNAVKLFDIVDYLRDSEKLELLYKKLDLSSASDAILIYMKDSLSLHSELKFFEIEKTEDELIYSEDDVTYIQFFPLNHAADIIDSLSSDEKKFDNLQLAKRLLEYRINDA